MINVIAKNKRIRKRLFNAAFQFPGGMTILLRQAFKYVNQGRSLRKETGKTRILLSMEQDRRYELLTERDRYGRHELDFLWLPNRFFMALYEYHMRPHIPSHSIDNTMLYKSKGVEYQKSLSNLYIDLQRCLHWIAKTLEPDLFLSASLGDSKWKHLCKIAREEVGVPWMITEREGVISKLSFTEGVQQVAHEFSPSVDFMSVSNRRHAERWHRIGIPSHRISVIGELKSDFWTIERNSAKTIRKAPLDKSRKSILYFGFGDRNYINSRELPFEKFNWKLLREQHLLGLERVLKSRDDVDLIIKGGHAGDLATRVKDLIDLSSHRDRLTILGPEFDAIDLIKRSDVIVGMQTTAIIEAHFTEKPIVYAGWGSMHDEVYERYLLPLKEGDVDSPKDQDDFVAAINRGLSGDVPINVEKRKSFRERYFFCPDGNVHDRLLETITHILDVDNIPEKYNFRNLKSLRM